MRDHPGTPTLRNILLVLAPATAGVLIAAAGSFYAALFGVPASVWLAWLMRHRWPGIWPAEGLQRSRLGVRQVIQGIAGALVALVVMSVVGTVLQRAFGWQADLSAFRSLGGNLPLLLLWLAIVWTSAAFGEEILARGILLRGLAEGPLHRMRHARLLALVLSSVLFGLAHAYQGPSGIVLTMLVGLTYGGLYLRAKGNLWPGIVAHGLTDTIGFVALYVSLTSAG